jgi:hypothetical protein
MGRVELIGVLLFRKSGLILIIRQVNNHTSTWWICQVPEGGFYTFFELMSRCKLLLHRLPLRLHLRPVWLESAIICVTSYKDY